MIKILIVNDGTAEKDPENMAYPPGEKPFCIVGNYDYKIFANDELIGKGRIENHNRISGVGGLIRCLADKFPGPEGE